jgi:two-component system OmpR family sensor kinase
MRRIGLEAQRMGALLDDMLRLARLDQHPEHQREPVDLTALLNGCVERAQITESQLTWQTSIAPNLVTVGDEELLRRAIDNLIANVHTHTPDNTVATITAVDDSSSVVIEVSDNGPGVPADRLPHIFDRFYRAGAQPSRPGAGLGLSIVAEIATVHGGIAEATLNRPHGLRVTVTLPTSSPLRPVGTPVANITPSMRR